MEKAKDIGRREIRPQNFTKIHMKVELFKFNLIYCFKYYF